MPKRLLVIDDERMFGAFVRRVAEELGFETMVTSDARSFKAAYHSFAPTMITLDIVMPEVDGLELVLWLAEQGCTARIIVISGYSPSYSAAAAMIGEAKGLVSVTQLKKPVAVADLRAALSAEWPGAGRPGSAPDR